MLVLVALDQITKQLALAYLGSGQTVDLLGRFLGLKLIFNSGAAFSLGSASTWIFTILATIVTIAMPYFMYRLGEAKYQYVLAVIWSGAIGNLIDRLFREPSFGIGHVIDFIRYGDWFIGNVADILLVIGVIALIVMQFFDERGAALKQTAHVVHGNQAESSTDAANTVETVSNSFATTAANSTAVIDGVTTAGRKDKTVANPAERA